MRSFVFFRGFALVAIAALSLGCGDGSGPTVAEQEDPTNPSIIAEQQGGGDSSGGADSSGGDSSGGDSSAP